MKTEKLPRTAAVLLAAGLSSRMGRNKLLIELEGIPLIRRVAKAYCDAGMDETIVVTGHDHEAVESAVAGLNVCCVFNPEFAAGQPSSIRSGLVALSARHDAVLIGLGDMPLLAAADIRAVAARWATSDRPVCVPHCNGRPGHPVAFAASQIAAILDGRLKAGRQRLLEDNPGVVDAWESGNPHYVTDIDTPEDLRDLAAQDK